MDCDYDIIPVISFFFLYTDIVLVDFIFYLCEFVIPRHCPQNILERPKSDY